MVLPPHDNHSQELVCLLLSSVESSEALAPDPYIQQGWPIKACTCKCWKLRYSHWVTGLISGYFYLYINLQVINTSLWRSFMYKNNTLHCAMFSCFELLQSLNCMCTSVMQPSTLNKHQSFYQHYLKWRGLWKSPKWHLIDYQILLSNCLVFVVKQKENLALHQVKGCVQQARKWLFRPKFFSSSKWAQFRHVAFHFIEKHSPPFKFAGFSFIFHK